MIRKLTRWAFTIRPYQSPPFKPGFMKPSDLEPKDAQNVPDTLFVGKMIMSKRKIQEVDSATELTLRE